MSDLESSFFWTVVAFLLPLFGLVLLYKRKSESFDQDPYRIRQCPNPNCIRCTRYAEVNASAQRRLPWILWSVREQYPDSEESDLKKDLSIIEKVVQQGPDANNRKRKKSPVSPTFGQYPTVLLVEGLATQPLVTHLHAESCHTLLRGGDTLREAILEEYMSSNSPDPDHGSQNGAQWLENDVANSEIGGAWHVLHILNQGIWNTNNMKACPKTAKAIQSLMGLLEGCIFGNAFISVLKPGTTIEPHCGPSNVRHRLHFALQAPDESGQPVLTVASTKQTWETGKCFVFDDSLTHSVDYIGSETDKEKPSPYRARVVLIADLWHPHLTEEQRAAIIQLYPSSTR